MPPMRSPNFARIQTRNPAAPPTAATAVLALTMHCTHMPGYFTTMKILAFSDVHRDLAACEDLVARSADVDVVVGAGDFASVHDGLQETLDALKGIDKPTLLVPGNNETAEALRIASDGWESATVLHGAGTTIDGQEFFGLGGGIPTTPWDWSFDLTDSEAAQILENNISDGSVLILHSPPYGLGDSAGGTHFGSDALRAALEANNPALAVFGHIHESWGYRGQIGDTVIANLGPQGDIFEL